jgi:hypothetical protein
VCVRARACVLNCEWNFFFKSGITVTGLARVYCTCVCIYVREKGKSKLRDTPSLACYASVEDPTADPIEKHPNTLLDSVRKVAAAATAMRRCCFGVVGSIRLLPFITTSVRFYFLL